MHQLHSVMAAPILGRKGLLGLIYTDQQDVAQTFSADDLDLLNAVAVQTGVAIDTVHAHQALQREAQAREKYERFLPQQLVDDVMLDPQKEVKPGGRRQTVTALFADLRGFTTVSEANTPEMVVDLLNRFFTLMSEVIFRHGGTLDKYIGDGVMALFGAPYSTERDAVKAVRAAIEMQRSLGPLNDELARERTADDRPRHRHQHRPGHRRFHRLRGAARLHRHRRHREHRRATRAPCRGGPDPDQRAHDAGPRRQRGLQGARRRAGEGALGAVADRRGELGQELADGAHCRRRVMVPVVDSVHVLKR